MKKRVLLLLLALALLLPLVSASAGSYYYISGTSYLRIREKPNTEARIKDSYRQDYAVVSFKKYDRNWAYVHFSNGEEGYVMRKYLKSSSSYTAYVMADQTSLRSGPAATFDETDALDKGAKVTVLTSGNSWSYVSSSKGKGYIRKSLLSATKISPSPASYTAYVVNPNGRTVNVRRGAGKNYAVVTTLEPGTKVTVEKSNKSWTRISSPHAGWIMNEFISKKEPSPVTGTSDFETFTAKIVSKNGKQINVRRDAGMGYAAVGRVESGTKVTVIGKKGKWYRISGSGITGYVSKEFVKK